MQKKSSYTDQEKKVEKNHPEHGVVEKKEAGRKITINEKKKRFQVCQRQRNRGTSRFGEMGEIHFSMRRGDGQEKWMGKWRPGTRKRREKENGGLEKKKKKVQIGQKGGGVIESGRRTQKKKKQCEKPSKKELEKVPSKRPRQKKKKEKRSFSLAILQKKGGKG